MVTSFPRHGRQLAGRILCAAAIAVALAGCSDARRTFGLERVPPDEFAVLSRAPLSMPPDFNLRPPEPGAPRPQEERVRTQAAAAVFGGGSPSQAASGDGFGLSDLQDGLTGTDVQPSPAAVPVAPAVGQSQGEAALLARAGADQANPDIRTIVDRETTTLAIADRSFIDRLMFWQEPPPPGTVVDAQAESQRLRENAALGRPVTAGETPSIVRTRKAPLEGLLN